MNARFLSGLVFAGVCLSSSLSAASADSFLIMPGKSIGQTRLGPNGAAMLKRLPQPDAADNGMMQTRLVWVSRTPGRTDTLFIHGVSNSVYDNIKPADGTMIDTIRITSRQFHTLSGVSTTSTLAQVRRRFPSARADHLTPQVYNDMRHGIAFEFALPVTPASRCLGISVFKPSSTPGGADATQSQVDSLLKDSRTPR